MHTCKNVKLHTCLYTVKDQKIAQHNCTRLLWLLKSKNITNTCIQMCICKNVNLYEYTCKNVNLYTCLYTVQDQKIAQLEEELRQLKSAACSDTTIMPAGQIIQATTTGMCACVYTYICTHTHTYKHAYISFANFPGVHQKSLGCHMHT